MADVLGKLVVEIVGDAAKLAKTLKNTKKESIKFSDALTKAFKGIAFTAVIAGVVKVGDALISAASDAEETRNKFNVVFQAVADDAKAAVDRISEEFKLSDSTTETFLSQVGDITSGLGATSTEALDAAEKITKLGLDIDSFANLSGGAEQAVRALTSLFTGEREAAKALGIVINDNNLKAFAADAGLVFKELTPLEKGFLSLELATSQSQLAIGDFARSSDSFANENKAAKESVKSLQIPLGEVLLPTATEGVRIFGDLAQSLADFTVASTNARQAARDNLQALKDAGKGIGTSGEQIATAETAVAALQDGIRSLTDDMKFQGGVQKENTQKIIDGYQAQIDKIEAVTEEVQTNLIKQQIVSKVVEDNIKRESDVEAERARLSALKLTEQQKYIDFIEGQFSTTEAARIEQLREEISLIEENIDSFGGLREEQQLLIDLKQEELDELTGVTAELIQIEEDRRTAEVANLQMITDEAIIARDTKILAIEAEVLAVEAAELRKQAAIQSTSAILSSFDSIADTLAQAELTRLEESGASQDAIAKKKRDLARENAVRERAAALFSIAVDTPVAIVKALTAGPFLGPILASVIGGLAAAQGIALLSAPVIM